MVPSSVDVPERPRKRAAFVDAASTGRGAAVIDRLNATLHEMDRGQHQLALLLPTRRLPRQRAFPRLSRRRIEERARGGQYALSLAEGDLRDWPFAQRSRGHERRLSQREAFELIDGQSRDTQGHRCEDDDPFAETWIAVERSCEVTARLERGL